MPYHAVEDDDIFGRAPQHITHARIDESVEVIEDDAFLACENLVHVETHNRIRKIGEYAFDHCRRSLSRIDIKSVVEIGRGGFSGCENLQFVEFGDKLESIGYAAFSRDAPQAPICRHCWKICIQCLPTSDRCEILRET